METLYERWKDRREELKTAMTAKQANYHRMVEELWKFYQGDHSPMKGSGGYLAKAFPQSYAGGRLPLSSQPLLKRVIDAQATLFHRRAGWVLKRKDEELPPDDVDVARFADVRKEMHYDLGCRYLQRQDRLFNTVFARVAHRLGKLQLDVIRPSCVEAIESKVDPANLDDAEAIAVVLSGNRREIWERPCLENDMTWRYGVVDFDTGEEYDPLFDGSFINGYGTFPFVAFSHNPSDGLYGVVDDSLLDAQVGVDLLESWADFQFRLGFSVAVLTTGKELGKDEVPISPDIFIKLTPAAGEQFERVPSGLDAKQLTEYIEAKVKRYAAMAAVDPDFLSSDSKQFLAALTGVAKQFDRLDLQELREESEVPYEERLPLLFDKTRIVRNWHRPDEPLSEDVTLSLDWYMPPQPQNRLQEAQADKMDIEAGILTVAEVRARRLGKPAQETDAAKPEPKPPAVAEPAEDDAT